MYKLILLLFTCAIVENVNGQQHTLILGLESTFSFAYNPNIQESNALFSMPVGLSIEKPMGNFSLGTGLSYRKQGPYFFTKHLKGFNPRTRNGAVLNDGEATLSTHTEYWTIPLRIQFRLPCNCIYIQISANRDFAFSNQKARMHTVVLIDNEALFRDEGHFKKANWSYSIGMGFKVHYSTDIRLFARPEYEFIPNPFEQSTISPNTNIHRFSITMGLQYAMG